MKNRPVILFLFLQTLYPLCLLAGLMTGREFVLYSEVLYLVGITALSSWLAVQAGKGAQTRWAILALVAALVHALTLLAFLRWWGAGIAAVTVIVCGWMVFDRTPRGFLRGLSHVATLLLTFLLILVTPIWFFAATMGSTRVVKTLDSPDKTYTAIVTSRDQGALGGDTLVEVRNNRRSVPFLTGSFAEKWEVRRGGWGDWEKMELVWTGEDTLSINGTACPVDRENILVLHKVAKELDVSIQGGQVLEYRDTHGGFHGDGTTFVKIQGICSLPGSRFWHPLPASPNAAEAIRQSGVLPAVEDGWYYVNDRHSQCPDRADGTCLLSHGARNYTLAVYDPANGILYYYELDT